MCYEKFHDCRFCKKHYLCDLSNFECPTVNFDLDMNICDDCRILLLENIKRIEDKELESD